MKLIADSGSTKSVWYLDEQHFFHTEGFNPVLLAESYLYEGISQQLLPQLTPAQLKGLTELHFFGAGCAKHEAQDRLRAVLTRIFPNVEVFVGSDMLAAAKAACGQEAGLVSILGTGCNCCYFDGQNIQKSAVSLGYLLGDEGGGYQIGRELVKRYLYGQMPADLAEQFGQKYQLTEPILIKNAYQNPSPNRYLASFAEFGISQLQHPYIQTIIDECLSDFFRNHLLRLGDFSGMKAHFIGSISYLLQDRIKPMLAQHHLEAGLFLKTPFPQLLYRL